MTAKLKEIDFKSLLIGFLLAAVFFLTIGASSGTRDVRIVGINTYDDLRVSVEKINTRDIPVKITDVDSSAEL
ncbi:MAG: hypothetical protein GY757_54705, partial [bacterium]|nr:hypothetical protein [bacterium]